MPACLGCSTVCWATDTRNLSFKEESNLRRAYHSKSIKQRLTAFNLRWSSQVWVESHSEEYLQQCSAMDCESALVIKYSSSVWSQNSMSFLFAPHWTTSRYKVPYMYYGEEGGITMNTERHNPHCHGVYTFNRILPELNVEGTMHCLKMLDFFRQ